MQVNLQYAEEHFAELAKAADNGEVVEISRPDKPALKLVVSNVAAVQQQTGKRILGAGRGEMIVPTWEEWQAMDKYLKREMLDAPLVSSGVI